MVEVDKLFGRKTIKLDSWGEFTALDHSGHKGTWINKRDLRKYVNYANKGNAEYKLLVNMETWTLLNQPRLGFMLNFLLFHLVWERRQICHLLVFHNFPDRDLHVGRVTLAALWHLTAIMLLFKFYMPDCCHGNRAQKTVNYREQALTCVIKGSPKIYTALLILYLILDLSPQMFWTLPTEPFLFVESSPVSIQWAKQPFQWA